MGVDRLGSGPHETDMGGRLVLRTYSALIVSTMDILRILFIGP